MNSLDILQLCYSNLLRRRTRTVLSVVGVIIGTTAIVVMLSIGFGLSQGFQDQLESFGNLHLIEVYNWGGGNGKDKLDDRTLSKIERMDGVTCVSPRVSQDVLMAGDHKVNNVNVIGIKADMLDYLNISIEKGRAINNTDKSPLLFGKAAAAQFYDPRKQESGAWGSMEPVVDVLGKFILTNDYNYGTNREGEDMGDTKPVQVEAQGVGLLANEDDEYAYNVYTTIEFAKSLQSEWEKARGGRTDMNSQTYNEVMVYVEDLEKVSAISEDIRTTYGFSTFSLTEMLKEMNKTALMIQAVLGGIGGISLFVAAIGIANTMIMSVYERTGEISVMKVIGASLNDIRKIFLIEAGMIGFGGGVIGIALSFMISRLFNTVLAPAMSGIIGGNGSSISIIPVWLAFAALAFATFMGVISGYSPAKRAMNLSVLEGLKNE